jgi:hypothetical protein
MGFKRSVEIAYKIARNHGERGVSPYELAYYLDKSPSAIFPIVKALIEIHDCYKKGERIVCVNEESNEGEEDEQL